MSLWRTTSQTLKHCQTLPTLSEGHRRRKSKKVSIPIISKIVIASPIANHAIIIAVTQRAKRICHPRQSLHNQMF